MAVAAAAAALLDGAGDPGVGDWAAARLPLGTTAARRAADQPRPGRVSSGAGDGEPPWVSTAVVALPKARSTAIVTNPLRKPAARFGTSFAAGKR